jgi:DNA topoisomerase-6 subunit B
VTVYRYANRIPLLFEAGNDVCSIVANKKIKWGSYKIKPAVDKIGVFVSIVSTKVPFKGTSKEYIGNDNGPLANSVCKAVRQCCVQLKKNIVSHLEVKAQADRKKGLTR